MYSNVVLRIFNNPANAGRISKPDGIADIYNVNQTAHVEFSLRIESGIITDCKFRAQANPYIIAICSTITNMVKGKMIAMLFLDPYSIKTELGDEADIDIMFCIDCLKLAVENYKEKIAKENKKQAKEEKPAEESIAEKEEVNEVSLEEEVIDNNEDAINVIATEQPAKEDVKYEDEDDDDDFFLDFFDDSELE